MHTQRHQCPQRQRCHAKQVVVNDGWSCDSAQRGIVAVARLLKTKFEVRLVLAWSYGAAWHCTRILLQQRLRCSSHRVTCAGKGICTNHMHAQSTAQPTPLTHLAHTSPAMRLYCRIQYMQYSVGRSHLGDRNLARSGL